MKKEKNFFLGFFVLILMVSAMCAWIDKEIFDMTADGQSQITVRMGKEFFLRLQSQPSTGFRWEMAAMGEEFPIRVLSVKTEEAKSDEVRLGGYENQLWLCKALKRGEFKIVLHYLRPWEKGILPARIYTFIIKVE